MKEQVSVDKKIRINANHEAWHRENKISCVKRLAHIYFNDEANDIFNKLIEEYERLKRLDDNVQQRIKASKSLLALNAKTRSYSLEEIEEIDDFIKLLESLYDEKQGRL